MRESSSKPKTVVIAAIIAGICPCLAAIIAAIIGLGLPIVSRLVDIYLPITTPTLTSLQVSTTVPTDTSPFTSDLTSPADLEASSETPLPPTEKPQLPTATVVIAPTATQTVTPTPQPAGSVTQVTVLGYKDDGETWCTNIDGTHTITYDSGAYSPFPTDDGCDPKGCWKSTVFIYKNSNPDAIFAGSSKGEPHNPNVRIGWDEWLTTAAEVEAKTRQARQERPIDLQAGDCLTFIAIDGRDAYHWPADNRGKVILNVYSP